MPRITYNTLLTQRRAWLVQVTGDDTSVTLGVVRSISPDVWLAVNRSGVPATVSTRKAAACYLAYSQGEPDAAEAELARAA